MEVNNPSLRSVLGTRDEFIRVILVLTVLGGLGLNLFVTGLASVIPVLVRLLTPQASASGLTNPAELYQKSDFIVNLILLVVGLFVILGVIIYIGYAYFSKRTIKHSVKAAILFDMKQNRLRRIPDYQFGSEVGLALSAVLLENTAIKRVWEEYPLVRTPQKASQEVAAATEQSSDKEPDKKKYNYAAIYQLDNTRREKDDPEPPHSANLLREAIEFVLLDMLSTHLRSHFNRLNSVDDLVKTIDIYGLPDFLRSNKVLKTISTPISERPIFTDKVKISETPDHVLQRLVGEDGALFYRFELTVPSDSDVTKPEPCHMQIRSKRLDLHLKFEYDRFSTHVPEDFLTHYVGVANPNQVKAHQVKIELEATVKASALLSRQGWELYEWVDSFATELTERADLKAFINLRQWPVVSAMLRSQRNLNRAAAKQAATGDSTPEVH